MIKGDFLQSCDGFSLPNNIVGAINVVIVPSGTLDTWNPGKENILKLA